MQLPKKSEPSVSTWQRRLTTMSTKSGLTYAIVKRRRVVFSSGSRHGHPQGKRRTMPWDQTGLATLLIANNQCRSLSRFVREAEEDVFRITITSFLDAYNFDVRRVMKCCVHHVLPSRHVVPFCAYNTLYRTGIVSLPELTRLVEEEATH